MITDIQIMILAAAIIIHVFIHHHFDRKSWRRYEEMSAKTIVKTTEILIDHTHRLDMLETSRWQ